jgi:hypothetical protein
MNFLGCTSAMKANAEKYVKANYVANWAPEQHVASVVLALIQPKKKLLTTWLVAFKSLVETQLDGEESETEQSILPSPQSEVDKYLALPQLPLQRNGKDTTPSTGGRFIPTSSPTLQELPCMHPLQVPSVCFQQQARCMMDKIRTPRRTRCPYSWRSR